MSIQINITNPCHENWNAMTPVEQGRFCAACAKTVIDFSNMSEQEVLAYFSTAGADVCGRLNAGQLNKTIHEQSPKRFSWAYAWNMIIAATLFSFNAKGQSKKTTVKKTAVSQKKISVTPQVMGTVGIGQDSPLPIKNGIGGVVLDRKTRQPVSYASITVKGMPYGLAADSAGRFMLRNIQEDTIRVSALGYEAEEFGIDRGKPEQEIWLQPAAKSLDPVVVQAPVTHTFYGSVGGLSYVRHITIQEKAGRLMDDLLPKKDVKVYPNPVPRGNAIQVQLALKETGEHRVELLAANGQVMYACQVQVYAQKQTISVWTGANWSKGIYWLRITRQHTKDVYQAKVLVQ